MTPIELLRLVVEPLKQEDCLFAVCGGIAAGAYRTTFRVTNDLDIALSFPAEKDHKSEKEFAIQFLETLGMKVRLGWIYGISSGEESNVFMVIGEPGGFLPTIDFLLPNIPWVRPSVARAQNNLVDFGFGTVPTVTAEDLIVAKAYALNIEPTRLQDKNDIDSILSGQAVKDKDYLESTLRGLCLSLPTQR